MPCNKKVMYFIKIYTARTYYWYSKKTIYGNTCSASLSFAIEFFGNLSYIRIQKFSIQQYFCEIGTCIKSIDKIIQFILSID